MSGETSASVEDVEQAEAARAMAPANVFATFAVFAALPVLAMLTVAGLLGVGLMRGIGLLRRGALLFGGCGDALFIGVRSADHAEQFFQFSAVQPHAAAQGADVDLDTLAFHGLHRRVVIRAGEKRQG